MLKKAIEYTIGLILSALFILVMGIMLIAFSPFIAKELYENDEILGL